MDPVVSGKIRFSKKQVMGYALTAAICIWCLIYINRAFGVSFLAALFFAPIVSFLLAKASRISVTVALTKSEAYKGEIVGIMVTVESGGFFPVPFVHIEIDGEPYVVSVSKGAPAVLTKAYQAHMWGTFPLGVSAIAIHDYLGLFKIAGTTETLTQNVSVYPVLYEPQKNDVLHYISNAMSCSEMEDEQSGQKSLLTQPGYEFRPYIPGDPLNRVNWKLLAKYDTYMVRENEYIKSQDLFLIIDPQGSEAYWEERTVEAVLAMLTSLVKADICCKVCFYCEDRWQEFAVGNEEQITALQHVFIEFTFAKGAGGPRVPAGQVPDGALAILFTCAPDAGLYGALSALPDGAAIVCPEETADGGRALMETIWLVNQAYDFYAL